MPTDIGSQITAAIQALNTGELTQIVRAASGDDSAVALLGWDCKPLQALSVGNGTIGFFEVDGDASTKAGLVRWSSIVKAVRPSGTGPSGSFNDPLREIEAYRSRFFEADRRGMKAAPCYSVHERPDGTVWLWLKNLRQSWSEVWSRADYLSAARDIGLFNATLPEGKAPDAAWLDRIGHTDRRRGPLNPQNWANPLAAALDEPLVRRAADGIGTARAARFLDDIAALIEATSGFPRTVAHNDCHTRNLFCSTDDAKEPVTFAIDWASVGLSPMGVDGGTFLGSGFTWGQDEARMIGEIEPEIFDAYYGGAVEAGWQQPRQQVRLSFLSGIATYTLQSLMVVHQVAIGGPIAGSVGLRSGLDTDSLADGISERLTWMVPLIDEALELAAQT